jgi:hypothetical protein
MGLLGHSRFLVAQRLVMLPYDRSIPAFGRRLGLVFEPRLGFQENTSGVLPWKISNYDFRTASTKICPKWTGKKLTATET